MKHFLYNFLKLILCGFLFTACSTERSLIEFEKLETGLKNPQLNSELLAKTAPRPKLPAEWRGRKLFSSPWAYIYAKNKESAEYVYDELEEISESKGKQNSYGLVIVTGTGDTINGFDYQDVKALYETFLKEEKLFEGEKEVFEKDLEGLNKIQKFHDDVYSKADEKKDENEMLQFRQSIDRIITFATFFIQPEIMEQYMQCSIDESVYWCAFISVDDTIDENLDNIVSSLLNDYKVSSVGKGLIWGIISPGFYFKKRDIIKETKRTFAEGYKKNALLKKPDINFSDRAIDQSEAGVNGSE